MTAAGFRFKDGFFDRTTVLRAMDKKTAAALSRFGSHTRTTAQQSLKYSDEESRPGKPPRVIRTMQREIKKGKRKGQKRAVSPLREFLYFAYDPRSRSVVVGPELFRNAKTRGAARALEEGGSVQTVTDKGVARVIRIRARPFMLPAFQKNLAKAPGQWAETASGPLK